MRSPERRRCRRAVPRDRCRHHRRMHPPGGHREPGPFDASRAGRRIVEHRPPESRRARCVDQLVADRRSTAGDAAGRAAGDGRGRRWRPPGGARRRVRHQRRRPDRPGRVDAAASARRALPELTGPGVRLVEGLRRAELRDGHWTETDEAGWLAMSRDDRDSVMSSLRAAADIAGAPSRSTSTDQGADCVIDTYPPDRRRGRLAGAGMQLRQVRRLAVAGHLAHRTRPTIRRST